MAAAPVTEAEVTALLAQPMSVDDPVQWIQKGNDVWAEAALRVRHPNRGINLSVRMTVNLVAPEKFSLSLLLDNSHRIRGIDAGGSHENKHTDSNRWIHQTHEHWWTDACHGSWADAIQSFPQEAEAGLTAFCLRLGIVFNGEWRNPPGLQLGLEGP